MLYLRCPGPSMRQRSVAFAFAFVSVSILTCVNHLRLGVFFSHNVMGLE